MRIYNKGLFCLAIGMTLTGCSSAFFAPSQPAKYESRCVNYNTSRSESLDPSKRASPIYIARPEYPTYAFRHGIDGYVVLEFDISERGRPVNIGVIESFPADMFDQEAIEATSNSFYEPIASECIAYKMLFEIRITDPTIY